MKTAAESAEDSPPGFKGSVGVSSVTENEVREWGNVGWREVDVDLTKWGFQHTLSLFRGHEAHGAEATGGQEEEEEEEEEYDGRWVEQERQEVRVVDPDDPFSSCVSDE